MHNRAGAGGRKSSKSARERWRAGVRHRERERTAIEKNTGKKGVWEPQSHAKGGGGKASRATVRRRSTTTTDEEGKSAAVADESIASVVDCGSAPGQPDSGKRAPENPRPVRGMGEKRAESPPVGFGRDVSPPGGRGSRRSQGNSSKGPRDQNPRQSRAPPLREGDEKNPVPEGKICGCGGLAAPTIECAVGMQPTLSEERKLFGLERQAPISEGKGQSCEGPSCRKILPTTPGVPIRERQPRADRSCRKKTVFRGTISQGA